MVHFSRPLSSHNHVKPVKALSLFRSWVRESCFVVRISDYIAQPTADGLRLTADGFMTDHYFRSALGNLP